MLQEREAAVRQREKLSETEIARREDTLRERETRIAWLEDQVRRLEIPRLLHCTDDLRIRLKDVITRLPGWPCIQKTCRAISDGPFRNARYEGVGRPLISSRKRSSSCAARRRTENGATRAVANSIATGSPSSSWLVARYARDKSARPGRETSARPCRPPRPDARPRRSEGRADCQDEPASCLPAEVAVPEAGGRGGTRSFARQRRRVESANRTSF